MTFPFFLPFFSLKANGKAKEKEKGGEERVYKFSSFFLPPDSIAGSSHALLLLASLPFFLPFSSSVCWHIDARLGPPSPIAALPGC